MRVIAATHRRLITHIADKTFREDLYYRLNVVHIEVPPLRDRREDVHVLLHHYLARLRRGAPVRIRPSSAPKRSAYLTRYHWPGNVRELRNVAERLVLRVTGIGSTSTPCRARSCATPPRARARETAQRRRPRAPSHQVLFERLVTQGASFWSEVYEPFMARDLTRHEMRELVRLGLEHTRGNYKLLVTTFNMPPEDYKKFLNFLRKYQCHVPFQRFRMAPADLQARAKFEASA